MTGSRQLDLVTLLLGVPFAAWPTTVAAGDNTGDPHVIGATNVTGEAPRLPIYLAQATGSHPTLETILAQVALIVTHVLAAASAWFFARRRSRTVPHLAEA